MEAVARRILVLLNATEEIFTDKVDDEVGMPYSCPTQHRHN
jgi:hypothetical protein